MYQRRHRKKPNTVEVNNMRNKKSRRQEETENRKTGKGQTNNNL